MEKKTPQEILDELSNTEFRGDFEDTLDIACHPDTDIDRITTLVKSAMEAYAKQETERLQSENERMREFLEKRKKKLEYMQRANYFSVNDGYELAEIQTLLTLNNMELNEKDKELIAKIDERLKHYKLITDNEQPITEQKQRWQPAYGCKYWYIGIDDGNIFISDFHWGNDDVDFIYHDTANCFKTQEEAERAAQAIRETLKNI